MATNWKSILIAVFFAGLLAGARVRAQEYPTKPINLLVSFAAGGPWIHVLGSWSRGLENIGQELVVINRPGGGGSLAQGCWQARKVTGIRFWLTHCRTDKQPHLETVLTSLNDVIP